MSLSCIQCPEWKKFLIRIDYTKNAIYSKQAAYGKEFKAALALVFNEDPV